VIVVSPVDASGRFHQQVLARLQDAPDQVAVVEGERRITRRALYDDACRLGSALRQRGVPSGAAIAFQLPNWVEACVLNLAAVLYGFRLVPLLPMYRESELTTILQACRPAALFLPAEFRGLSYPDLYGRLASVPVPVDSVFVVRGSDARYGAYEDLLTAVSHLAEPTPASTDAVKTVLYTSGSTGRPKGVVHTDRSISALIDCVRDFWGLTPADVALVPSPVAHIGGSLYAFDFPWAIGMRAVLMDTWVPERAVDLIEREGVTFCAGATPFLDGLLKAAAARNSRLPSLRRFICGGASVPPGLVHQASERFTACTVSRAYGSTEVPVICPGVRTRADALFGATTDGECAADVRILGEDGRIVPDGEPGEIVVRADRMFQGYLNPEDNADAFTDDGYFRMGDIGRRVAGRFIEITGRKKDLIIRLGENISPLEIENLLVQHPAVRQVSVVGIPDARTGEAALACVVLHEGAQFTLDALRDFLAQQGLARQKFPEYLRILPALPTNAIGKVLKRELQIIGRT
jgi:acyl-CoA synthetase (AMP-forming)/AMP-acid ligase II